MESFAFWYKSDSPNPDLKATMNFNLWSECGWGDSHLLDIGFKIENLHVAKELFFFVPTKIDKENISDLGDVLKDSRLTSAIFNENYTVQNSSGAKWLTVTNRNNVDDRFYVYKLDVTNDITLEHFDSNNDSGTIIKIKIKRDKLNAPPVKDSPCYFRFRITGELPFLVHNYSTPKQGLQSIFKTTYMIDFRYHNIRSLSDSLIERFHASKMHIVKVKSLHFLLITKAYISVADRDFRSMRKIEHSVWKSYVGEKDTADLVAYHFVDKAKEKGEFLSSSELFAKFEVEKPVTFYYVLLTVLLGATGSLCATALEQILKWLPNFIISTVNSFSGSIQ